MCHKEKVSKKETTVNREEEKVSWIEKWVKNVGQIQILGH